MNVKWVKVGASIRHLFMSVLNLWSLCLARADPLYYWADTLTTMKTFLKPRSETFVCISSADDRCSMKQELNENLLNENRNRNKALTDVITIFKL